MIRQYQLGLILGLIFLLLAPLTTSFASSSPTGFDVDTEFQRFYEQSGGLPVFGYAISSPVDEGGRLVQYFERQRLELHPEYAGSPYAVQLGHLGWQDAERRGLLEHDAFQPRPEGAVSGSSDYFPETGHSLGGGFGEYWRSHGLDFGDPEVSLRESLALFGYPISEEFVDPVTGLVTQYFERARFEFHPANAGTGHEVLLGHLGNEEMQFQRAEEATSGQATAGQRESQSSDPRTSYQPVTPTIDSGDAIPNDSVNVRDFGARGDGRADDTDAIIEALEHADHEGFSAVYVPEGTYMIRAGRYWYPYDMEIVVPDGISLLGAGRDATTLKVIPESVTPTGNYWRGIEVGSETAVQHLTLDGSKDAIDRSGFDVLQFQGIAFAWEGKTDVLIEDVRVHDIIGIGLESFGVTANGGQDSVYRNLETFNVEGTGIQVEGSPFGMRSTGLRLENSVSYNNDTHGISVMGNDGATVSNVLVYDNRDMGISVEWNTGEILLEDVESHGNGYGGIGSFGENESITISRPNLYQNNTRAAWFPGEIALIVADYWGEERGQVPRGVTRHLEVRDCVAILPRGGSSEIYYRHDGLAPQPGEVFDLDCEGSDDWSIEMERSQ